MDAKLILAADGSEECLIVLHQVLVHLGHDVVLASNGPETIAQAARHRPDAILLDLEMAGEQPRQILRALATEGWAATTPVIGIAGRPDTFPISDRVATVIRKPLALPALAAALDRCLDRPGVQCGDAGQGLAAVKHRPLPT